VIRAALAHLIALPITAAHLMARLLWATPQQWATRAFACAFGLMLAWFAAQGV